MFEQWGFIEANNVQERLIKYISRELYLLRVALVLLGPAHEWGHHWHLAPLPWFLVGKLSRGQQYVECLGLHSLLGGDLFTLLLVGSLSHLLCAWRVLVLERLLPGLLYSLPTLPARMVSRTSDINFSGITSGGGIFPCIHKQLTLAFDRKLRKWHGKPCPFHNTCNTLRWGISLSGTFDNKCSINNSSTCPCNYKWIICLSIHSITAVRFIPTCLFKGRNLRWSTPCQLLCASLGH